MIIDDELRHLYEISTQERLQRLEDGLQQLQKYPEDEALLEDLRRDAHSLKGDSRSVGVTSVETLIQKIEVILKAIQAKQISLTSQLSDSLHNGLNALGGLMREAVTGCPSEVNISQVFNLLTEAHLSATAQSVTKADASQFSPAASSLIDDEELRTLYEISSRERLQKLKAGLLHLKQHSTDAATLDELRQEAHSLKGDSRTVKVEDVEVLIQQIEEVLKAIQLGHLTVTPQVSDRLHQGLEAIEKLVQEAVTGQPSEIDVTLILDQLVRTVSHPELISDTGLLGESASQPVSPVIESLISPAPTALSFIDDEELRNLYELSSQQRLHKLKEGLSYLQEHPDDQATLDDLQREAHSLKGDSRTVGVEAVEALTQHVEAVLKALRARQIGLTAQVSDRIHQGLDAIGKLVQESVTGQPAGVDLPFLTLLLQTTIELEDSQPTPTSAKHSAFQVAPTYIEDEELREVYKVSSQERLQKMEAGLLHLEKYPNDETTLEQLLREAHSFKGDSRSVGLDQAEAITHQLEEILGSIKLKRTVLTPQLGDRLYQGLDAISKLVREAVTGRTSELDVAELLQQLQKTVPTQPDSELPTPAEIRLLAAPVNLTSSQTVAHPPLTSPEIDEAYRIDAIRIQTRELDALMKQVEELTVTKINIAYTSAEVEQLVNLWEDWKTSKNQKRLLDASLLSTNPYQERLENLINSLRASTQENSIKLDLLTGDLREKIRTLRLLPLSNVFQTFPRLVRDLAKQQSKEVELIIEGGETTADKRILEEIKDPLMHMVRNAIDHGIESPSERTELGKPPVAKIWLRAYQATNSVVVEVADDGRGLDSDKIKQTAIKRGLYNSEDLTAMSPSQIQSLIFAPGFSTRTFITEISGRGIGLDVVRTNVERLKGNIQVESTPQEGCTFRIQLSTSLTTIKAVLLEVQGIIHALPIEFVQTNLLIPQEQISMVEGRATITFNGQDVPIANLSELLNLSNPYASAVSAVPESDLKPCILLKVGTQQAGFLVDRLLDTQEVVIKPQSQLLKRVRNVSGATILPTGEVCTILNALDLIESLQKQPTSIVSIKSKDTIPRKPVILLVEDSMPVRTQERRLLEKAGYEVVIAVDGLDGYRQLQTRKFDAVLSDVEMPNLDGLSLTAKIRQHLEYKNLPIILVTTLDSDEDKKRGADAGADAYIIKGKFNQDILLEILGRLV
jgi:two-component system chemotaxis sensor kinase CheA